MKSTAVVLYLAFTWEGRGPVAHMICFCESGLGVILWATPKGPLRACLFVRIRGRIFRLRRISGIPVINALFGRRVSWIYKSFGFSEVAKLLGFECLKGPSIRGFSICK